MHSVRDKIWSVPLSFAFTLPLTNIHEIHLQQQMLQLNIDMDVFVNTECVFILWYAKKHNSVKTK